MAIKGPLLDREKVNLFYTLLAGGAKTKLLESVINFNLPELLDEREILESELINKLGLDPLRAKKWFFLLTRAGFLRRRKTDKGSYKYFLGPLLKALVNGRTDRWWFFKQMTYSWQTIAYENLYDILLGKAVRRDVHWPPQNKAESVAIEEWMTRTAFAPLLSLERAIDFSKVKHLLDIGGGEGTMACALAKKYPKLKVTLYNLPTAIELAESNIANAGLSERVSVVAGDFFKDEAFPTGCDLILFSRVLCDWSYATAERLLTMAYKALNDNGQVAICEAFQEHNNDFSIAWEFRYLFWDELETEVFKSSLTYKKILVDIGYKLNALSPLENDSIYTVLTAKKQFQFPFIQYIVKKCITAQYEKMQEMGG